jgi:hypothetical protein
MPSYVALGDAMNVAGGPQKAYKDYIGGNLIGAPEQIFEKDTMRKATVGDYDIVANFSYGGMSHPAMTTRHRCSAVLYGGGGERRSTSMAMLRALQERIGLKIEIKPLAQFARGNSKIPLQIIDNLAMLAARMFIDELPDLAVGCFSFR